MTLAVRAPNRTCPKCKRTFGQDAAFCPADGAALEPHAGPVEPSDPYIGMLLHGDIELRDVAGAGAMGRVYRAYQRHIDRDVAVKILHRELSGNASLVQRFHREAKIASRLQHPNVVEVFLAGQLPDGALYIVMEYLDGMSLAAAKRAASGTMPLERALSIVLQLCDAVGEGHARGVVHRDLKPENVILVRRAETDDWVKVLDFGIAKMTLGEQSMETAAGLIFGSARYISPEGAQGAIVGPEGDVYSIATIAYELLAGRTPFEAEQPVGFLIKHIHEAPPDLRTWPAAANVPEPIARVVMANLAKEPSSRAENARALGAALAAAAREANVGLPDVGVVARMSAHGGSVRPSRGSTLTAAAVEVPGAGSRSDTGVHPPPAVSFASRPPAEQAAPAGPLPRRRGLSKRNALLVVFAFLLGISLTLLTMQYVTGRAQAERTAHVQRARRALANGNYIDPPGESVRDLVVEGLAKWPDDSRLTQIQSDAAHEVVTRAMAARSLGDIAGARDLARTAYELDPTDGTAKLLLEQYERELRAHEDAP